MKPPAFQFYADDFLAGTMHLTDAEVGLYIRLLCVQWSKGGLPDNDDELLSYGKGLGLPSLSRVKAKFKRGEDGLLRNQRLEQERDKQVEYRLRQSANGRLGGRPGKANPNPTLTQALPKPNPTPNPNESSPSPSPSPSPDSILRNTEGSHNASPPPPPAEVKAADAAPAVGPVSEKPVTKPRPAPMPANDDAWIAELAASPAYAGIDVRREFEKCSLWCKNNRKALSRKRFINWINRVDKPMNGSQTALFR